jgi:hypothetical protein
LLASILWEVQMMRGMAYIKSGRCFLSHEQVLITHAHKKRGKLHGTGPWPRNSLHSWNQNVQQIPDLWQLNPVCILTPKLSEIYFDIILRLFLSLPTGLFPWRFQLQFCMHFLPPSLCLFMPSPLIQSHFSINWRVQIIAWDPIFGIPKSGRTWNL